MTGYCEQMDVHEGTSTVKEALIFSALLRQPRDVPYKEKIAYVDHIINLLELDDICDALIGSQYSTNSPNIEEPFNLINKYSPRSRFEH